MSAKLLVINVYFDPASFGGATIVAEQLADGLNRGGDFDVVATSGRRGRAGVPRPIRYTTRFGFPAYAVQMPAPAGYVQNYENPPFDELMEEILEVERPDVVHVHCIQKLGAGFFDILTRRSIPFVVTVHDCWWLCERQFMIDVTGDYCGQWQIDPAVCRRCNRRTEDVRTRLDTLIGRLNQADRVLAPSRFLHDLLAANGVAPARLQVNKNGVRFPAAERTPAPRRPEFAGRTVFGYVGGPGPIKGWGLIKRVFEGLDRDDICLAVVDAGGVVGEAWHDALQLESRTPMVALPPYDSETLDAFFDQIDVLLCPSRWKESFGLIAREALVRDVWVVASDAGGLAEDLEDGRNATVLPFPPSEAALREAVVSCIGRAARPLPGKDRVRDMATQTAELHSVLLDVLNAKSAAPAR